MSTLTIDPHASQPPFEQLRRQLIEQILTRQLPPGTKLPPVRRLAADLALAPNTVARTYRELEAEGYLITRGRNGTTVAPVAAPDEESRRRAGALTSAFVAHMRGLGFDADAIVMAVRQAL
ncbi:DNA-binding transcriptional regulator YhcF, GntR family [Propionibacterium cyclohexanicum]|uniref:DNA-binding transcriptional regulator YhcF, GntR family n=1 Tax=Propionibacterium cyclohexanicum TaxID=64702 RepID=A0A1H9TI47_9ACTN|nr:GntR family transcriptional regulator [Propionibacterium cyclohexanicum]SER96788.1 DNA-binding transcriptional regulator YhcF, GntR family [Propionibacterium cyclohexanicum]